MRLPTKNLSSRSLSLLTDLQSKSKIPYTFIPKCAVSKLESELEKQTLLREDNAIQCNICGYYNHSIFQHLTNRHKIKKDQYTGAIISEKELKRLSEKITGKNNPAYGHAGKLSVYSKNNPNYNPDKAKAAISKSMKTISDNGGHNTQLTYYMNRLGMNKGEAEIALRNRQATFSLSKCIEKYGNEIGQSKFKGRQDKWLASFNDRPDEELADIIIRRTKHPGKSKLEDFVYSQLNTYFTDIERQFYIAGSPRYFYDMRIGNVLVEVNGDYWHANPRLYDSKAIMRYKKGDILAEDIWAKDKAKIDNAELLGYVVIQVWEFDIKNDPQKVINDIVDLCNLNS